MTTSRRDFLRCICYWVASSSIVSCGTLSQRLTMSNPWPEDWLNPLIGNLESAARLGKAYLASHPEENNLDQLISIVDKDLQANNNQALDKHSLENIASAIKTDYINSVTVSVDNWILSRTEARLYALVTLSQGT